MLEDYFIEFSSLSQIVTTTLDTFESRSDVLTKEEVARIDANLRELKRQPIDQTRLDHGIRS